MTMQNIFIAFVLWVYMLIIVFDLPPPPLTVQTSVHIISHAINTIRRKSFIRIPSVNQFFVMHFKFEPLIHTLALMDPDLYMHFALDLSFHPPLL